jgi:hypothetical protein
MSGAFLGLVYHHMILQATHTEKNRSRRIN